MCESLNFFEHPCTSLIHLPLYGFTWHTSVTAKPQLLDNFNILKYKSTFLYIQSKGLKCVFGGCSDSCSIKKGLRPFYTLLNFPLQVQIKENVVLYGNVQIFAEEFEH